MAAVSGQDVYETDQLVSDYLLFHYGSVEEFMPWACGPKEALFFPVRTTRYAAGREYGRILDLGCAVGRSTFELTHYGQEVLGVDFSEAFVQAAIEMKICGHKMHKRGAKGSDIFQASVPKGCFSDRVSFLQGDAMNLPDEIGTFDLIHASNLICRLPDPAAFIASLGSLVNEGGRVILATPFSWLPEFTPQEKWPDGDSWEWLQEQMRRDFELMTEADEPFMIREHARKYQYVVSRVSVWKKKV